MEEKKYEVTEEELKAYICLGAIHSEPEELQEEETEMYMKIAADIAHAVIDHLNGRNPFPKEELDSYRRITPNYLRTADEKMICDRCLNDKEDSVMWEIIVRRHYKMPGSVYENEDEVIFDVKTLDEVKDILGMFDNYGVGKHTYTIIKKDEKSQERE